MGSTAVKKRVISTYRLSQPLSLSLPFYIDRLVTVCSALIDDVTGGIACRSKSELICGHMLTSLTKLCF
jgi:hypothetical protein